MICLFCHLFLPQTQKEWCYKLDVDVCLFVSLYGTVAPKQIDRLRCGLFLKADWSKYFLAIIYESKNHLSYSYLCFLFLFRFSLFDSFSISSTKNDLKYWLDFGHLLNQKIKCKFKLPFHNIYDILLEMFSNRFWFIS